MMMGKISDAVLILLATSCYCYASAKVVNVSPGIFSTKTESNELTLPATNTFQPIPTLTANIHIAKPYTVFVHYQFTLQSFNEDFYSKLLINHYHNAGSLVHSGNQIYKTATGFYMTNLNPGNYTFEVHYKSPAAINVSGDWDWQTAVLQVMWFEDAYAISDGIKCYPTPTTTNAYNNWGPLKEAEATLLLQNSAAVLSAYQFSTEMVSPNRVVTSLEVDGFHLDTPVLIKGDNAFLDLHGAWATNMYAGPHYFNIQYRTPASFSFTDCKEKYINNKNLYAMVLPPSCEVRTIRPRRYLFLRESNTWASTDVTYSFTLPNQSHVIIMYQYSGAAEFSHVAMRLSINSVAQKHTVSLTGNTRFVGNFGLWQGPLNSGAHNVTLYYQSRFHTFNNYLPGPEWNNQNKWLNRVMTVITC